MKKLDENSAYIKIEFTKISNNSQLIYSYKATDIYDYLSEQITRKEYELSNKYKIFDAPQTLNRTSTFYRVLQNSANPHFHFVKQIVLNKQPYAFSDMLSLKNYLHQNNIVFPS